MTLDELEIKCKNCTKCDLCEGRTNLVFGVGKKDADIMLIGEGPGENEDLQGQPFVGRSGQLLDKFLASVDLSRDKTYISQIWLNVVRLKTVTLSLRSRICALIG